MSYFKLLFLILKIKKTKDRAKIIKGKTIKKYFVCLFEAQR